MHHMDAIDLLLSQGIEEIYPSKQKLEAFLRSGKKLRVYQGFDPTGPQLHIGHAVAIRKLRQFQDLGHHVIFLIGDATAVIGDPSGKTTARKLLTREEVIKNAEQYKEQAGKILRFDGENPVEILYNSTWLGSMNAVEFVSLAHYLTYQQVIERDMFQKRVKEGQELYMNEFLYPILQGYDSVAMDVDVEIGGTDQLFNMMMGRKLMRIMKQKEKFVITVPLLTDAKGNKIGKTEGNVIGLTDQPNDFYAKIMSLGDDAIAPCFHLLTDQLVSADNIRKDPLAWKKRLAFELTKQFNTENEAKEAQRQFELRVQEKNFLAADLPEYPLSHISGETIVEQLLSLGLIESKSEGKRLIAQRAVSINNASVSNHATPHAFKSGDIIVVGKKKAGKIVA